MAPIDAVASLLGVLAAASVVVATILVIRLHVLPTGVDPVRDGVSAYALGRWGSNYRAQVIASGLAATLIVIGCIALGRGTWLGRAVLLTYAVARFVIVRYPTDPPGSSTLSPTGRIHALLAAAAFVALGIAAPALGLGLGATAPWDHAGQLLPALSVAVPIAAVATFAAGGAPSLRPMFGLVERTIYVTGFAWLLVVSLGLAATPLG